MDNTGAAVSGRPPANAAASMDLAPAGSGLPVDRETLLQIRRNAIAVVRATEALLRIPSCDSAIRTRVERRGELGEK